MLHITVCDVPDDGRYGRRVILPRRLTSAVLALPVLLAPLSLSTGAVGEPSTDFTIASDRPGHVYGPSEAAVIRVDTPTDAVGWALFDSAARRIAEGTVPTVAGTATIELPPRSNGRYRLAVDVGAATRSTGIAWVPATSTDPAFGLAGHWVDNGSDPNWHHRTTEAVHRIGVGTIRTDVQWPAVERQRGRYDFSEIDRRIAALEPNVSSIIVPLDYGHEFYTVTRNSPPVTDAARAAFAGYAAATVEHLEARFPDLDFAFEVYNEWPRNIPDSAAQYVALLDAVADRVDEAPHRSPLVGGVQTLNSSGEHDWWSRFLRLGGADRVQVVSAHPYTNQAHDPGAPDICSPLSPETCTEASLQWLRNEIDRYAGSEKPLWVTENGWWSAQGQGGSVAAGLQAAYLVRGWVAAARVGVSRYVVYEALDDVPAASFDRQAHFGVFGNRTTDWGAQNAAVAYATLIRQLSGLEFVADRSSGRLRVAEFSDGERTVRVLWSVDNTPVTETLPLRGQAARTDMFGRERTVSPTNGTYSTSVDSWPVFLAEDR